MPKAIRPGQYRSGTPDGQPPTYPTTPTMQALSQSRPNNQRTFGSWSSTLLATQGPSPLYLEDIPEIMRARKMFVAANLLDHWFKSKANFDPKNPNVRIVPIIMEWVLTFQRAKIAYDNANLTAVWKNSAAEKVFRRRFSKLGLVKDKPARINYIDVDLRKREDAAINSVSVGDPYTDPMDDLFAALGRFNFYYLIEADVTKLDLVYLIKFIRIGVCVCDSFDFNGSQFLGCWNPKTNYIGASNKLGTPVHNSDFCDWRLHNKMGGDFLIHSDIVYLSQELYQEPAVVTFY